MPSLHNDTTPPPSPSFREVVVPDHLETESLARVQRLLANQLPKDDAYGLGYFRTLEEVSECSLDPPATINTITKHKTRTKNHN